jgi:hypothetical protein
MRARLQSALLVVLIMIAGSAVLWVGIPLAWLWIAGQIQGATGQLGLAIAVALFGSIASIALMMSLLGRLSNLHREIRARRGEEDLGHFVLEVVVASSAIVTMVGFAIWFFLFAGTSPVPVNIGF